MDRVKERKSEEKTVIFFLQLQWNVVQKKVIVTLNEQICYSERESKMLLAAAALTAWGLSQLNWRKGMRGESKGGFPGNTNPVYNCLTVSGDSDYKP